MDEREIQQDARMRGETVSAGTADSTQSIGSSGECSDSVRLKWRRANPDNNMLVRELEKAIGMVAAVIRKDVREIGKTIQKAEKMRHV